MDFLLVPDALTASETRYALAQRNTMGTKVGSFSVLLETLAELWLIEPSELDWNVALQEQALAMDNAFWAKSIRVDEPATVAELKASIVFLLNHSPVGARPEAVLSPANRNQRYYNDLVALARRIGERPAPDQLAEQWFAEHNELSIEPVYVYPLCAQENLYPWQRQILDLLMSKGWLAPEPDKYTFIPTPVPADENSQIQQFASTLFHPEESIIELQNLYWLTCRDHLQEVEAVTSMVQAAVEQGTKPERIAVVVPKGGDCELWLEKHFEYAGLIASNLRPDSGVFDWQSSLIHDLLTSLVQPDIPMAMMSAIINPLMPWAPGLGHKLAKRFGKGDELILGNEPSEQEKAMLRLLLTPPEPSSVAVLDWIIEVGENTQGPKMKGLGKKRMKTLLDNIRRLMGLYSGQPFIEQISNVIRQIPVATLESQEDRVRYLHAINIIREGEPLPFQVDEFFVLGFNQGHYVYQLDSNWRSTPELMEFINGVGAALFGSKYQELDLKAGYKSDLPALQVLRFSKDDWNLNANAKSSKHGFTAEGNIALANHIKKLLGSGSQITDRHSGQKRPIRGSDIAVLARGHSRLGKFAEALRNVGIEVQIQQPGFLACESVRWVLNALQALNNRRDHYAWLDLLTSPLMGGQSTERLSELLVSYAPKTALNHSLKDLLEPLGNSLRKQPVKNQLLTIIEEARLFETLNRHPQGLQYRANLIKLLGLAEEFESLQPETLNAMGIAGKNASTFPVWLNENKDSIDEQPTADPQAEDAVVLKTWHSSKGLEWPAVMVLDAEKASEPRFPSISMAYPDGDMESMLRDSFVQILPKFEDERMRSRFSDSLEDEQIETNRNIYYVALTRAREQLILPCWDGFSDGSMLSYILPLVVEKENDASVEQKQVTPTAAEKASSVSKAAECEVFLIKRRDQLDRLKHSISPSLDKDDSILRPRKPSDWGIARPWTLKD